jgi:transposase-like protein
MEPTIAPGGRAPRRRLPEAEKRRIVEGMLRDRASAVAIAREYGVNPTTVHEWKRRYGAGELSENASLSSRAAGPATVPRFMR